MTSDTKEVSVHRANYTLELGVWYATCKVCGFRVSDPVRRRAAAVYREHIKESMALDHVVLEDVIDLRVAVKSVAAGS